MAFSTQLDHRDAVDHGEPAVHVAPGKRTRSSRLPPGTDAPLVQQRANPAPAIDLAGLDDPFALHLLGGPVQRQVAGLGVDVVGAAAARGVAGSASPLPYLAQIQASFGRHEVGAVQAHVGGAAAEASAAMGAQAYATGNHVAFAGAPDLHTAAHEAAHVVQQRGGVQLKGGVGEVGDAYEQHADAVAALVVQGRSAESLLDHHAGGASGGGAVQRRILEFPDHVEPKQLPFDVMQAVMQAGRFSEFSDAQQQIVLALIMRARVYTLAQVVRAVRAGDPAAADSDSEPSDSDDSPPCKRGPASESSSALAREPATRQELVQLLSRLLELQSAGRAPPDVMARVHAISERLDAMDAQTERAPSTKQPPISSPSVPRERKRPANDQGLGHDALTLFADVAGLTRGGGAPDGGDSSGEESSEDDSSEGYSSEGYSSEGDLSEGYSSKDDSSEGYSSSNDGSDEEALAGDDGYDADDEASWSDATDSEAGSWSDDSSEDSEAAENQRGKQIVPVHGGKQDGPARGGKAIVPVHGGKQDGPAHGGLRKGASYVDNVAATGNTAALPDVLSAPSTVSQAVEGIASTPIGMGMALDGLAQSHAVTSALGHTAAGVNELGDLVNIGLSYRKLAGARAVLNNPDAADAEIRLAQRDVGQGLADIGRSGASTTSKGFTYGSMAVESAASSGLIDVAAGTTEILSSVGSGLALPINMYMGGRSMRQAHRAHLRKRQFDRLQDRGSLKDDQMQRIGRYGQKTSRKKLARQSTAAAGSVLGVGGSVALTVAATTGVANIWNPVGWVLAGAAALAALGLGGYKLYRWDKKRRAGKDDGAKRLKMADLLLSALESGGPAANDARLLLGAMDIAVSVVFQDGQRVRGAEALIVTKFESW